MRYVLQDKQLDTWREEQTLVAVSLINGVKLVGRIESFDQFAVTVTHDVPQMVYKRAISHIQAARPDTRPTSRPTALTTLSRRDAAPTHSHSAPKEPVVIVRKKLRTIVPSAE